mmetsp:Transcript_38276/g.122731  ORF Transcript_38276/g.122731 Transcript_38276/m.122731 type:complete len:427 (-) Transcript_38276:1262-2542(-)
MGLDGDYDSSGVVLALLPRRRPEVHLGAFGQVLPDHGPRRGFSDGGADLVPADAVHGHFLFESGHLPIGRRPTQGQYAREGLLRRRGRQNEAGHLKPPHALRPEKGSGEDEQVGPGLRRLHGGFAGRRFTQDFQRLLRPTRPRNEPLPRLRQAHHLRAPRRDLPRSLRRGGRSGRRAQEEDLLVGGRGRGRLERRVADGGRVERGPRGGPERVAGAGPPPLRRQQGRRGPRRARQVLQARKGRPQAAVVGVRVKPGKQEAGPQGRPQRGGGKNDGFLRRGLRRRQQQAPRNGGEDQRPGGLRAAAVGKAKAERRHSSRPGDPRQSYTRGGGTSPAGVRRLERHRPRRVRGRRQGDGVGDGPLRPERPGPRRDPGRRQEGDLRRPAPVGPHPEAAVGLLDRRDPRRTLLRLEGRRRREPRRGTTKRP